MPATESNRSTVGLDDLNNVASRQNTNNQLMRIPLTLYTISAQALVDTGAAASFISFELIKQLPLEIKLEETECQTIRPLFKTVSGEIVESKGSYKIKITLDKNHHFEHVFHVMQRLDEGCILGIDFLVQHGITVDPSTRSLTYNVDNRIRTLTIPLMPLYGIVINEKEEFNLPDVPQEYQGRINLLLNKHRKLFAEKMSELGMATAIKHKINTGTSPPINIPNRRTPHTLRVIVKTQIEDMEKHNIIRESTSPYAAPVVMVPKKGGEMRFCIDYRQLNKVTIKDKYPLPRIDDTIDALHGAKYFSTLDLFSGYWQIEIDEEDKHKTAFVCEYGQYEFNRMPFGLTNAPGTFQRLMNKILKNVLYKSTLVYLDDIIVYSTTIDKHIEDIETVFKMLAENGLKLKIKKCYFFRKKIDYLGHVVSSEGVSPSEQKVHSVLTYPEPRNVKEVSSFLGLASYYRKFIRAFAEKAHPLTKLTRKSVAWEWGDKQRNAFNCIKTCLTSKPILKYPDFSREFIIYTDASGYGIGAVLAQMQCPPHSAQTVEENDEVEVVIAYSSKHLNDRESKWSTTEKEAYAIIHAIQVFKPYLYGRKFTVITDHKPLEWLMSKSEPSGRLARWALKIQEFDITIGYRAGKTNQNADSLSRIPILTIAKLGLKEENDWTLDQSNDDYCRKLLEELKLSETKDGHRLLPSGELIDKHGRLVVPANRIKEILEMNHDHMLAGHLGIAKTLSRLQRQYVWPGMRKDVETHINSCLICARRKAYGQRKAPLHPIPPADKVWERIAMDIVGPLQESRNGNKYILVISDYASRFVITIAMEDQRAQTVAAHFVEKVITKYGAPRKVLTDQGTNFLSKLVKSICTLFKITQLRTTSYHPQTDGLVERFNRTLCDMLACYVNEEPETWDNYLPFVTLAYNAAKQSSLAESPFYLFYGREPNLPSDLKTNEQNLVEEDENYYRKNWLKALEIAKTHLLKAQDKQKFYYDQACREILLKENDIVLLKAPQVPGKFNFRWNGPFIITKQIADLNFEISPVDKNGKIINPDSKQIVHVNRLKLHTLNMKQENSFKVVIGKEEKSRREVTTVKRRVGRPRKFPLVQSTTVQGHIPQTSNPKRRGRPPKVVSREITSPYENREGKRTSPRLVGNEKTPIESKELATSDSIDSELMSWTHSYQSPLMTKQYNLRRREQKY